MSEPSFHSSFIKKKPHKLCSLWHTHLISNLNFFFCCFGFGLLFLLVMVFWVLGFGGLVDLGFWLVGCWVFLLSLICFFLSMFYNLSGIHVISWINRERFHWFSMYLHTLIKLTFLEWSVTKDEKICPITPTMVQ